MGDNSAQTGEITQAELAALDVGDAAGRWEALGFMVRDGVVDLGGIRVSLGAEGRGITRWAIRGIEATGDIDGLPTTPNPLPLKQKDAPHPNGATGIDHVVVTTPDFDRTAASLEAVGMPLRRVRHVGDPGDPNAFRQGFRRLGPAILELVEARTAPPGPARFWGLVVIVTDLHALADRLGEHLGAIKDAVQAGRRIATLKPSAGLTEAVAFMDEEP